MTSSRLSGLSRCRPSTSRASWCSTKAPRPRVSYFLCHGAVKLYQSGRFGNDHILAISGPGDVLGELPVRSRATYSTSAEALVESQVCYLARDKIERVIQNHPMVGVRLLASLSGALGDGRRQGARHGAEAGGSPAGRVARASLVGGRRRRRRHRPESAYSRRDIARMINVSTETAIRLLAKLKKRGMLASNGRELVITDVTRLRRLASQSSPL